MATFGERTKAFRASAGCPTVWVDSTARLLWQLEGATLDIHCYASCTTCLPPVPEDCSAGDCCGEGTVWDAVSGTCVADGTSAGPCVEDIDNDGAVGVSDILLLLGSFGEICE